MPICPPLNAFAWNSLCSMIIDKIVLYLLFVCSQHIWPVSKSQKKLSTCVLGTLCPKTSSRYPIGSWMSPSQLAAKVISLQVSLYYHNFLMQVCLFCCFKPPGISEMKTRKGLALVDIVREVTMYVLRYMFIHCINLLFLISYFLISGLFLRSRCHQLSAFNLLTIWLISSMYLFLYGLHQFAELRAWLWFAIILEICLSCFNSHLFRKGNWISMCISYTYFCHGPLHWTQICRLCEFY